MLEVQRRRRARATHMPAMSLLVKMQAQLGLCLNMHMHLNMPVRLHLILDLPLNLPLNLHLHSRKHMSPQEDHPMSAQMSAKLLPLVLPLVLLPDSPKSGLALIPANSRLTSPNLAAASFPVQLRLASFPASPNLRLVSPKLLALA